MYRNNIYTFPCRVNIYNLTHQFRVLCRLCPFHFSLPSFTLYPQRGIPFFRSISPLNRNIPSNTTCCLCKSMCVRLRRALMLSVGLSFRCVEKLLIWLHPWVRVSSNASKIGFAGGFARGSLCNNCLALNFCDRSRYNVVVCFDFCFYNYV